jgi:predicted nucleotidyltransferase
MRTSPGVPKTLRNLLFGQTRGSVLALLYGTPDQPFFVRQIARQTEISSVGAVQRELETLAAVGLISRSTLGNQVFYQANREHPAYAELHSLIAKTLGIFQQLRSALAPLAKRISVAFVYGSIAAGEEKAGSDVDLMVIGDVTLDEVLQCLAPAERAIGRPINPTVYSLSEFKSKLHARNHFLSAVMRGKNKFLIGDADDLRKVA